MRTAVNFFQGALVVALATVTATLSFAGERPGGRSRTATGAEQLKPRTYDTARESSNEMERWGPPKAFDPFAELEATSIEFKVDYHFGADEWYDHRIEAKITNIDTVWSGWGRAWEYYIFPPNGAWHTAMKAWIPPLAPGETYKIVEYLYAPTVGLNDTYLLILKPGDADSSNDFAIDFPYDTYDVNQYIGLP